MKYLEGLVVIFVTARLAHGDYYQEPKCKNTGVGQCMPESCCPSPDGEQHWLEDYCPAQPIDIRCCTTYGLATEPDRDRDCCNCDLWHAKERDLNNSRWTDKLPKCPCKPSPCPQGWFLDPSCGRPAFSILPDIGNCKEHPDANMCLRSNEIEGGHAQQCCYDTALDPPLLPADNLSAGTADKAAVADPLSGHPSSTSMALADINAHQREDVTPFEQCCELAQCNRTGNCRAIYFQHRPAPNADECNDSYPADSTAESSESTHVSGLSSSIDARDESPTSADSLGGSSSTSLN